MPNNHSSCERIVATYRERVFWKRSSLTIVSQYALSNCGLSSSPQQPLLERREEGRQCSCSRAYEIFIQPSVAFPSMRDGRPISQPHKAHTNERLKYDPGQTLSAIPAQHPSKQIHVSTALQPRCFQDWLTDNYQSRQTIIISERVICLELWYLEH